MIEEFDMRAKAYESCSPWVSDKVVCSCAVNLITENRSHLGHLLDAGGGTGYLAKTLALELPYHTVTVMDKSPAMLANVPQEFNILNHDVTQMDALNQQFDTILLRQVLHYLEYPYQVLKALNRSLTPNGIIYIGQIVAPNTKSAQWLQGIASQLSGNRRRVWHINQILSISLHSDLQLESISLHPFTDRVGLWIQRATKQICPDETVQAAKQSLSPTICKSLNIRESENDLQFEALFFHSIFSKRSARL